jgi:uncharacterized damage-inducible protein DinB
LILVILKYQELRMSNPTQEPLVDLLRHHLWANLRLLDGCEALTDDQLDETIHGTFGSIRATLSHLAGAEESYIARLTGEWPADALREDAEAGIADIRAHLRRSGEGLIREAQRVGEIGHIRVSWGGNVWQVPAGIILAQAINHATEHRAQISTIITQQGLEPPEVDGWAYVIATIPTEEGAG